MRTRASAGVLPTVYPLQQRARALRLSRLNAQTEASCATTPTRPLARVASALPPPLQADPVLLSVAVTVSVARSAIGVSPVAHEGEKRYGRPMRVRKSSRVSPSSRAPSCNTWSQDADTRPLSAQTQPAKFAKTSPGPNS